MKMAILTEFLWNSKECFIEVEMDDQRHYKIWECHGLQTLGNCKLAAPPPSWDSITRCLVIDSCCIPSSTSQSSVSD